MIPGLTDTQIALAIVTVIGGPIVAFLGWKIREDHKASVERERRREERLDETQNHLRETHSQTLAAFTTSTSINERLSTQIAAQTVTLTDLTATVHGMRSDIESLTPHPVDPEDDTPVQHRRHLTGYRPPRPGTKED